MTPIYIYIYIQKPNALHATKVGRHDQSATTAPPGTLGLPVGGTRFEAVGVRRGFGSFVCMDGWVGVLSCCLKGEGVVFFSVSGFSVVGCYVVIGMGCA